MNTINNDMIFEILKFLPIEALLNMAINHWFLNFTRNTIWPCIKSSNSTNIQNILKNYIFTSYYLNNVDDDHLSLIKNNTKIIDNCISIINCNIINGSHQLKFFCRVDLSECLNLSDQCLKYLNECEIVNLSFCNNITDVGISFLKNCKKISLKGCEKITDKGISKLVNCHTLNLSKCKNITDKGISNLRNCHTLILSDCIQLTDNGIKELHKCQELYLNNVNVTDDCLKILNCRILSLMKCDKITDVGMKYGKKYDMLNITFCDNITDEGIKNLNCKSIKLGNDNITDEGIKNLKNCEDVNLIWCISITDVGVAQLNCKNLKIYACPSVRFSNISEFKCRRLNVCGCPFMDDEKLRNFKGLELVDISKCNITDAGISHIENCKEVIMLHCFGITSQAILNLKCNKIVICECINLKINASHIICVSRNKCFQHNMMNY